MRTLLIIIAAFVCSANVFAQIDLTSGGVGVTTNPSQSYNETRAADITVLSGPVHVTSVTLKRFVAINPKALVGLRVYNSATKALLLKKDSITASIHDGAVTIPASFVLDKGASYRIGFYCHDYPDTSESCSAYMFLPTFPYVESSTHFRINNTYQSNDDLYPETYNQLIPFISLEYDPVGVDEVNAHHSATVYPNPFAVQTTIRAGRKLNNGTLTVYDPLGRVVKHASNISGESVILHRDNLAAGVYYIMMKDGNEIILSDKILIGN